MHGFVGKIAIVGRHRAFRDDARGKLLLKIDGVTAFIGRICCMFLDRMQIVRRDRADERRDTLDEIAIEPCRLLCLCFQWQGLKRWIVDGCEAVADRLHFFRRLHGRFFGRRHLRLGIYDHTFGGTDEGFLFLEALRHEAFHIVGDLHGFVRGLEDFLLVVFQRPHPRLDVGRVVRSVHRDAEIDR